MATIDPTSVPETESGPLVKGDFEYLVRKDLQQASLFSPDQLAIPQHDVIVPQRLRDFKKPVAALHSVPLQGSQSLNSRKLFDALILHAQIDVRSRGPGLVERLRSPTEPVMPIFEARIADLCEMGGMSNSNPVRVMNDLRELLDMRLSWNIVGEDAKVDFEMEGHFLTQIGRGLNRKAGSVRYSIEPSVLLLVLDPSSWATLSLEVLTGLKSSSAYALYSNCWRYARTDRQVTAALPLVTWIELLLGQSRFVKTDAEGRKYVDGYGQFKQRVLLEAMERVNSVAALSHTIELVELKKGRRVERLQFRFRRKVQQRMQYPVTWPDEVLQPLAGFGYTEDDMAALGEAHSVSAVQEALLRFSAARQRLLSKSMKMTNPRRYFEGILQNVSRGEQEATEEAEQLEVKIREDEAKAKDAQRAQRNLQRFQDHRDARFKAALFALPEARRREVQQAFEASAAFPGAKPLLRSGWDSASRGALVLLCGWLEKAHPEIHLELLPEPQDRTLEGWLNWRVEQVD